MRHDNIIGLLDVFTPATALSDFNDVYLVTPLMGADLNNIVKTQKLTDDHVQFLVYQILRGMKYVHSAGIIHRVSLKFLTLYTVWKFQGFSATQILREINFDYFRRSKNCIFTIVEASNFYFWGNY